MDYQILGCGRQGLSSVVSSCEDVAADFRPHGLSGALRSQWQGQDAFTSVVVDVTLDRLVRQPSNISPFFGRVVAMCQMVAAGRERDLPFTDASHTDWRGHL